MGSSTTVSRRLRRSTFGEDAFRPGRLLEAVCDDGLSSGMGRRAGSGDAQAPDSAAESLHIGQLLCPARGHRGDRRGRADDGDLVEACGERRTLLVDGLRRLGFGIDHAPEGAFYVLADARAFGTTPEHSPSNSSNAPMSGHAWNRLRRSGRRPTTLLLCGGAGHD